MLEDTVCGRGRLRRRCRRPSPSGPPSFQCGRVWRQRWLRKAFITRLEDFRKLFRREESQEKNRLCKWWCQVLQDLSPLWSPVAYQVSVDVLLCALIGVLDGFLGVSPYAWPGWELKSSTVWSEITQIKRHQQGSERKWRTFKIKHTHTQSKGEPFQSVWKQKR